MIDKSIPWGFVTIVVDAFVTLNDRRRAAGKSPMGITFLRGKNDTKSSKD